MGKKRHKLSPRKSKKIFSRTALKTNKKNVLQARPMRGGIRL
jgi:hypothetical protein